LRNGWLISGGGKEMIELHPHIFNEDGKCYLCGIKEMEWRAQWKIKPLEEYYTEGTGLTLRELQAEAEGNIEQVIREDGYYQPLHYLSPESSPSLETIQKLEDRISNLEKEVKGKKVVFKYLYPLKKKEDYYY